MAYLIENNPDKKKVRESKCTHCNVIFHEGHINQCPLVQDHPLVSDEGEQSKFRKASEYLGKLYPGRTNHFTIMDWWLNGRKFKNFDTIYSIIRDNLSREDVCYGPNSSARCSARSHSGDVIYFYVCCSENKLIQQMQLY